MVGADVDRRRAEDPGRARCSRSRRGRARSCSPARRSLRTGAEPDPESHRTVRDAQVVRDVQVAEAVEDERDVGRALDREVVPDRSRGLPACPADLPGLHRLRLRREEVVADGRDAHVRPAAQAEQPHVVPDPRRREVKPASSPSATTSCPTVVSMISAPDSVPAATMSCPIARPHDARSGDLLRRSRRGRCSSRDVRAGPVPQDQVVCDRRAGHGAVAAGGTIRSRAVPVKLRRPAGRRRPAARPPSPRTARAGRRRTPATAATRLRSFHGEFPPRVVSAAIVAPPLPGRYRPATVTSRARVPRAGTARGRRRGRPGPGSAGRGSGRRWRSCCCTRTASCRSSGSRTSCTPDARPFRGHAGAAAGLGAPARARLGGRDRDAAARLPAPRPRRQLRPRPLRAPDRRGRARARAGRRRAAAALLRDALELWRGPPLADLAYESFAHAAVERLEELRLAALEERIDAELALGRHAPLVASSRPSSRSIRCASGCAAS